MAVQLLSSGKKMFSWTIDIYTYYGFYVVLDQGDQIGRIFAQWAIVNFGQFL
jgi:hypothetical protein